MTILTNLQNSIAPCRKEGASAIQVAIRWMGMKHQRYAQCLSPNQHQLCCDDYSTFLYQQQARLFIAPNSEAMEGSMPNDPEKEWLHLHTTTGDMQMGHEYYHTTLNLPHIERIASGEAFAQLAAGWGTLLSLPLTPTGKHSMCFRSEQFCQIHMGFSFPRDISVTL